MVSYKPGSRFRPKDLRDALKKTDVGVVQVQISARGRVVDEGGRRVFVAGLDRFVVDSVADGQLLPADALVLIEGIVNDQANPMDLKVLTAKPVKP